MHIQRLFEIVYILLQKKKTTAKELAEHFEVSTRTIYRDLDALSMAGIPLYTNKGNHGGIFLMEDFTISRSILNEEEQQHLLSALQSYHIANHEDIEPLLTKLSAQFRKDQINWIDVDFNDWSKDTKGGDTFKKIKQAIFSHTCISFTYFNSYGQKKERQVEPFRLLFKGQSWYLIAYCLAKSEQRMFKLHRMDHVTSLNDPIQHVIDEEQLQPSSHYLEQEMLDIHARIAPSHVFRVYDEYKPEHYKLQEDGSMLLHIAFPRGEWVYGYLMGFGDAITIIEPIDIKEELIRRYRHILQVYEKENKHYGS